jgi:hypothetical protein
MMQISEELCYFNFEVTKSSSVTGRKHTPCWALANRGAEPKWNKSSAVCYFGCVIKNRINESAANLKNPKSSSIILDQS